MSTMNYKINLVCAGIDFSLCTTAIPDLGRNLAQKEKSLNEKANKINEEWHQKRLEFLRTTIWYDVLKLVTDESKHPREIRNPKDKQMMIELHQNLRAFRQELKHSGLHTYVGKDKCTEKLSKIIQSEMKSRLLQILCDLLSHYKTNSTNETNNAVGRVEVYQRAHSLPMLIRNDLDCLELMEEHKHGKYHDMTDMDAENQKKKTLKEHLRILNQIVDIHLTDRMPKSNHIYADHLTAKAKTLDMKLRSIEEEVSCLTYTKEACNELEKIRRKILSQMDSVNCEVAELDKQLANYKSISGNSNYEQLVEQYGQLKGDIEGKIWALKELTK